MKPGEGVCCMFLLAISGFTLHKICQNTKGEWLNLLIQLTNKSIANA